MLNGLRKQGMSCPVCNTPMDYFASIPAAVNLPELLRFKCQECGLFKTIEDPAWQEQQIRNSKAA